MRKSTILFFILLLIASCSGKKKIPKGILPQEKMQAVLWSMITAGEFLNGYILSKDSIDKTAESSKIYGQALQVHHVTKEEFDKSYAYYKEHPELLKIILDSLNTLYKRREIPAETQPAQSDTLRKKIAKPVEKQ